MVCESIIAVDPTRQVQSSSAPYWIMYLGILISPTHVCLELRSPIGKSGGTMHLGPGHGDFLMCESLRRLRRLDYGTEALAEYLTCTVSIVNRIRHHDGPWLGRGIFKSHYDAKSGPREMDDRA